MEDSTGGFRILSRRAVRPEPASSPDVSPSSEPQIMELTPWDLQYISVHYIQKGVVFLHRPQQTTTGSSILAVADDLAASFARALGRFYPLAGRFVVTESANTSGGASGSGDACLTVSLSCTNDGAEFVHAAAPEVSVSDIVSPRYSPPVLRSFFPSKGVLCGEFPPVHECFFHLSAASVRSLKAKANAEMAAAGTAAQPHPQAAASISSLQAVLAHLWRGACRARRLPPDRETTCLLPVGCRGRVRGVPEHYMGSAVAIGMARCAAAHVVEKGLGCTAWLLKTQKWSSQLQSQ